MTGTPNENAETHQLLIDHSERDFPTAEHSPGDRRYDIRLLEAIRAVVGPPEKRRTWVPTIVGGTGE